MSTIAVIPARYNSSRFPGKPLVNIDGKTMIRRVYEQVQLASITKVIVATDDFRIADEVKSFGGEYMMTSPNHLCGTDRCIEVINELTDYTHIINIQGDEPFINPEQIKQIDYHFQMNEETSIITLAKKLDDESEYKNPNCVKVRFNEDNIATSFDRIIKASNQDVYKHIGIYGFRTDTLLELSRLSISDNEKRLKLEQLRWTDNSYSITVLPTIHESISIDTPEDLKKISSN
jgi:3-deoxy-manno-octulosonate cytidylyltransferase (CMP-KDO synthetase)